MIVTRLRTTRRNERKTTSDPPPITIRNHFDEAATADKRNMSTLTSEEGLPLFKEEVVGYFPMLLCWRRSPFGNIGKAFRIRQGNAKKSQALMSTV